MEFITHRAITRIFKREIDAYQIKSITLDDDDNFNLEQIQGAETIELQLYHDIQWEALWAKREDEVHRDRYEDSDTIKQAISQRQK